MPDTRNYSGKHEKGCAVFALMFVAVVLALPSSVAAYLLY